MGSRLALSSIDTQARMLRARIESERRKPAVIVVTSAENGDGASFTAHTLARSFAESGRRTALFDATREANPHEIPFEQHRARRPGEPAYVSMPTSAILHAKETLRGLVSSLRSSYEIVIVDSPPIADSNAGVVLGELADAVLVAVRVGRRAGAADDLLISVLDAFAGSFLGVVATAPDAIAEFERHTGSEAFEQDARYGGSVVHADVVARPRLSGSLQAIVLVALLFVSAAIASYGAPDTATGAATGSNVIAASASVR